MNCNVVSNVLPSTVTVRLRRNNRLTGSGIRGISRSITPLAALSTAKRVRPGRPTTACSAG